MTTPISLAQPHRGALTMNGSFCVHQAGVLLDLVETPFDLIDGYLHLTKPQLDQRSAQSNIR
ncbi:MAG: hypothetical protein ACLPX9_13840 [Rhodomicrobium sp.]